MNKKQRRRDVRINHAQVDLLGVIVLSGYTGNANHMCKSVNKSVAEYENTDAKFPIHMQALSTDQMDDL